VAEPDAPEGDVLPALEADDDVAAPLLVVDGEEANEEVAAREEPPALPADVEEPEGQA